MNGKLIGAPAPPGSHKQQRTYFSAITIVVDHPRRAYIEVTPRKVILDGRDRMVLPCHSTVAVDSGALSVSIVAKVNVTVSIAGNISFVILLHQYKNPAPYQRDHLGFYIGQSKGLSHHCHGLLGTTFTCPQTCAPAPDSLNELLTPSTSQVSSCMKKWDWRSFLQEEARNPRQS